MYVPPIKSVFEITQIRVDIFLPNIIQFYIFILPLVCTVYNVCVQGQVLQPGFDVKRLYIFYFQHVKSSSMSARMKRKRQQCVVWATAVSMPCSKKITRNLPAVEQVGFLQIETRENAHHGPIWNVSARRFKKDLGLSWMILWRV